MSFKDKNINKENSDDLDIKTHLDDFLDLSKITASEDLINRTLKAIKEQPVADTIKNEDNTDKTKEQYHKEAKKINHWNKYVRSVAGAAAAVLVIVAGFELMRSGEFGKKGTSSDMVRSYNTAQKDSKQEGSNTDTTINNKQGTQDATVSQNAQGTQDITASQNIQATQDIQDTKTSQDTTEAKKDSSQSYEKKSKESSAASQAASQASKAAGTTSDLENKTTFSSIASTPTKEADKPIASAGGGTKKAITDTKISSAAPKSNAAPKLRMAPETSTETGANSGEDAEKSSKMTFKAMNPTVFQKFKEICPINSENTANIRITDITTGATINLTDQAGILDFNSRMDKFEFSKGTDTLKEKAYLIEIGNSSAVPDLYTITVGDCLTIHYTEAGQETDNLYTVQDIENLKKELSEFMKQYSN